MELESVNLCGLDDGGGMTLCCDALSSDQYPASNLISREHNMLGFMAEYFIRPPVSLYFHLPFPAKLLEVSADTRIENQSTSIISISGSTAAEGIRCSTCCSRSRVKRKKIEHERPVTIDLTAPTDDCALFENLGKGEAVDGRVVFTNYSEIKQGPSRQSGYRLQDKSRSNILSRLSVLRITIVKTKESSVPCLKKLCILVKATNQLDQNQLTALSQQSKPATFSFFGGGDCGDTGTGDPSCGQTGSNHRLATNLDERKIPTEFLDEITHEIMVIPMVLPSGKIVDRSTIEKCNESQAVYGGLSRDPFSGLVYTSKSKPMFNASLKSRIDNFLVHNNMPTASAAGRTVGDAAAIDKFLAQSRSDSSSSISGCHPTNTNSQRHTLKRRMDHSSSHYQ